MRCMLLEMGDETKIKEVVENERYLWEVKKDGTRGVISTRKDDLAASIGGKRRLALIGREGTNMAAQWPELEALEGIIAPDSEIDSEVFVPLHQNDKSKPTTSGRTSASNGRFLSRLAPAVFEVFDCICWNGCTLTQKPLEERKQFIFERLSGCKGIEVIMPLDDPLAEWERIKRDGDEGLVAKLKGSPYVFERSAYWKKFKTWKEMDLPVIGFTSEKRAVSALILEGGYKVNFSLAYALMQDFLIKSSRTGREIKALDGSVGAEIAPLWLATFRYLHKSPSGLRFPTLSELRCDETKI